MLPQPGQTIIGREREHSIVTAMLDSAQAGVGEALVVLGEPGIGKTTLIAQSVARAADLNVVSITGIESEMQLPDASLHLLCESLPGGLSLLTKLPRFQRDALEAALGIAPGPEPSGLVVGVALLSLLAAATRDRALVCVLDDAHWLDGPSMQAIGFAARRLRSVPMVLLLGMRERAPQFTGLPELTLKGLGDRDAAALLESSAPAPLDPRVRDRVLAEAHGNPLALIELSHTVALDAPADAASGPDVSLSSRIEQSFRERLAQLSGSERLLLVVAAADPTGDVQLLHRVLERLEIDQRDIAACEAAGLLQVGSTVTFSHPLARSATYHAASAETKRRVHAVLAHATDPKTDPVRRVWHAAQATDEFDEDVATQLETTADLALAHGGAAARAAFLRRAAELTSDGQSRVDRVFAAMYATQTVDGPEAAMRWLALREPDTLDPRQAAQRHYIRAHVGLVHNRGARTATGLIEAAQSLAPYDVDLARDTWIAAFEAARFAGRFGGESGLRGVAHAFRESSRLPKDGSPLRDVLEGLTTLWLYDFPAGLKALRPALERVERLGAEGSATEALQVTHIYLRPAECIAGDTWDDEARHRLVEMHVRRTRSSGALLFLATGLASAIEARLHEGELHVADGMMQELDEITDVERATPWHACAVLVAAWLGDRTELTRRSAVALADATPRGEGLVVTGVHLALAIDANARSDHEVALAEARSAAVPGELGYACLALPELIEAGSRVGDQEAADAAMARMSVIADAAQTNWAVGVAARARALVSSDDVAEDHYGEALERLGRSRGAVDLARARLLYGEWLRRRRRRSAARDQLSIAYESFTSMGATLFAERARVELVATGGIGSAQRIHPERLTSQELAIARLAASGASNRTIAERLFMSPKTVENHLGRIFNKLQIRSRAQLSSALSDDDG
jgi:DNA-binding NarL/FixJ family response regulator